MKSPPPDLVTRLLDSSEFVLGTDPPPRLEDVAREVGTSRAALYYYFSGRDDLLVFLLTAHAKRGAETVRDAVRATDPPRERLEAMVSALSRYLGEHRGTCAGFLAALGAAGRMGEVLAANDTWIAAPLREVLSDGKRDGAFAIADVADAANTALGGILLGVLGRTMAGDDPLDARFRQRLTDQIVAGVLKH